MTGRTGSRTAMARAWFICMMAAWGIGTPSAHAQLVVTELMYNPLSVNDVAWEWIEVQNTGASAIDLAGYYGARLGDALPANPAVNASLATNTVIPAGATAVLYSGNIGGTGDYDDQAFRDAWGLSAGVPLIAVENWATLTNTGGAAVGYWPASGIPGSAIVDNMGTLEVDNFDGAAFSIDYRTDAMFPSSGNGFSIEWNGQGSNQVGANWAVSAVETGATTSVAVNFPAGQINNTADAGSPGVVPAGPAASGLLITEIMYNPASAENDWEWVEIYNNTGATINFGDNYVFSDLNSTLLDAPNVGPGTLANGAAAVLYNADDVTLQNMIDAWDPGSLLGVNFIGVTNFPSLTNSPSNGATTPTEWVAIWSSLSDYQTDNPDSSTRSASLAESSLLYDDDGTIWPGDNNSASIYLTDLSADQTVGTNWLRSEVGDGLTVNASPAFDLLEVHPGGDVGTPGVFMPTTGGSDADFDDDNDVDAADLATWAAAYGGAATETTGDADGSGFADGSDFLQWQQEFTGPGSVAAVPEPASAVCAALAIAGCWAVGRRSRRG
ncbi:MAG: hypothetical protein CMJ58_28260 [Planctomycetaceae bacterium]|nr:hypothetical protein [Planctomycetaceae bacterium]